ncbi:MAG: HAD-IB family phosphatase [Promethearchaeia archaeon]
MNKPPEWNQLKISAIGLDSPGLVSIITNQIYELQGNIVRMEENNQWGLFSIFLLADFSESKKLRRQISSELKAIEERTGLKIVVSAYNDEDLSVDEQFHHIVKILGPDQPGIIATISSLFYTYHINIETARTLASGDFFSMEMVINLAQMNIPETSSFDEQLENLKRELRRNALNLGQSIVIQAEDRFRRLKKLILIDIDSVLLEEATLGQFFSDLQNLMEKHNPQKKGMDSISSFQELINNLTLLRGIPIDEVESLAKEVKLKDETYELFQILREIGFKVALISSGLNCFIRDLLKKSVIDYAFTNKLIADEQGLITGEFEDPIIANSTKNDITNIILKLERIKREQIIGLGTSGKDTPYMKNFGLTIAYDPPNEKIETDGLFSSNLSLKYLLYCLGIPKTELDKYF